MDVAFLGLGTMGLPMADNLRQHGHRLTLWNRTAARAAPLVAHGARLAATPAEAAASAEVVITMLADPAAVEAVWAGADGALEGLRSGALAIDMSTVDPATARALHERVRARGGAFIDAPVSGSRGPAVEGKLLILCGGAAHDIERARPLLEAIGRVLGVGAIGQGMAMKLVLNGLGAHMLTGLSAMLVLGVRQGLLPQTMLEVIAAGAFSSPLYASKGKRILARDFSPEFTLALMLKDQELVLSTARALGCPLPILRAVREVLVAGIGAGYGDEDLAGIVRLFESWTGVTVAAK